MTTSGFFSANREEIAAKVIDGELIIIRLSDGTYYSMDNVGSRVWELMEGRSLSTVIHTLSAWYDTALERVEHDVHALMQDLLNEHLIVAADAGPRAPIGETPVPDVPAYEAPKLNIYRDMGNLLALDPPTPGIDDLLFKNGKSE